MAEKPVLYADTRTITTHGANCRIVCELDASIDARPMRLKRWKKTLISLGFHRWNTLVVAEKHKDMALPLTMWPM